MSTSTSSSSSRRALPKKAATLRKQFERVNERLRDLAAEKLRD
jgi:hypothetical protein